MLALKIALRYLLAKKSHRAVNVISVISVMGVAVATMAIVVVLSVFNGFTGLADSHLSKIDPELKVVAAEGKAMRQGDSLARVLEGIPQIAAAMPSVEERGLLVSADRQMPVVFRGVDPGLYSGICDFESLIVDGSGDMRPVADSVPVALLSVGVAVEIQQRPVPVQVLSLYVPRRVGRINPANPAAAYRMRDFAVGGVFQVDQPEYDADHIVIGLDEARTLLDYRDGEATAIELRVASGTTVGEARAAVSAKLGTGYDVLTRMEQQSEAFRMISVEKWVTFLMLVFILVIASFNVISTLSLLVIEKRDNMSTLRALGATSGLVKRVFMWEGWLVTLAGGVAGIILGTALSLCQQYFGWIKLSADPSALTITSYPVRVEVSDALLVFATIVVVGWVISMIAMRFSGRITYYNTQNNADSTVS